MPYLGSYYTSSFTLSCSLMYKLPFLSNLWESHKNCIFQSTSPLFQSGQKTKDQSPQPTLLTFNPASICLAHQETEVIFISFQAASYSGPSSRLHVRKRLFLPRLLENNVWQEAVHQSEKRISPTCKLLLVIFAVVPT